MTTTILNYDIESAMSDSPPPLALPPYVGIKHGPELDGVDKKGYERNQEFRRAWHDWRCRLAPEEKDKWVCWATRPAIRISTDKLYNHLLGNVKPDDINWADITAVMTSPGRKPKSNKDSDWAKKAQTNLPNADILKGQLNNDGATLENVVVSTIELAQRRSTPGLTATVPAQPQPLTTFQVAMEY
ncbi:hypothetical protein FSARC_9787 [Fusarium sarcochroum]|uniref:Uncharacterized protein n=1 Tax=Fusarium sarcochroum TaxID=1208366 RepID=A0A8H4X4Z8_9HYPO|nr:hypothetical protein FSARC_9787 [Fusarium sarcochroum]